MPRGGFTSTDDEIEDKESAELLLKQKAMQKYKINQYHHNVICNKKRIAWKVEKNHFLSNIFFLINRFT